ncbi:MAG: hypothetical protein LUH14_01030 [Clostridiaceae bacterium]|nr:hypothetical protein [Clostridiaceae bacterium]
MARKNSENSGKQTNHSDDWDMLIAYHLLQKDTQKRNATSAESKSDSSWLEAILCTIGGFVLACIVFVFLGVDAGNVPAVVIVIMWIICSILLMVFKMAYESKPR